ncbi:MAG: transglycosylase family protein [Candidatus Levybacteria bacterium]|nr:transglycosylase family protein [Candidatus Levybacteria bacterium]
MLENLAALAVASIVAVGSYAYSLVSPPQDIVSPLPIMKISPTAIPTHTPTLTPSPTATPTPQPKADRPLDETSIILTSSDLDALFTKYSGEYSVDRGLLMRIASCESGFNTLATNGEYGGMFQFSEGTWTTVRTLMGASADLSLRFNAEEAIKTASFKISRNEQNAWANCLN